MRPLDRAAIAAACLAFVGCMSAAYAARVQELNAPLPQTYALVLLVNQWDGGQAETVLARDMPAAQCLSIMAAIWRANGDAPLVGMDELGPIPAFDAACLPE